MEKNKYKSRKFLLTVFSLIFSFLGLFCNKIRSEHIIILIPALVASYQFNDVKEKGLTNKEK